MFSFLSFMSLSFLAICHVSLSSDLRCIKFEIGLGLFTLSLELSLRVFCVKALKVVFRFRNAS